MARHEEHREDLLREATALVERVAVRVPWLEDEVVVGFRADSSASFYFGQQRVYQFNSAGELRRAHLGESLYKADGGRLVSLHRQRTANAVELIATPLDDTATGVFLAAMTDNLSRLSASLAGEVQIIGQAPPAVDVLARVHQWLARHAGEIRIASSPRVR